MFVTLNSKNMHKGLILIFFITICINKIQAQCSAQFSFGETLQTIQFTDLSTTSTNDPIVSWVWDFDDNTTSNVQNPLHTFPDIDKYDVVLTITTQNGCTSSIEIEVEICAFTVSYSLGTCNSNNQIPVNLTINDVFNNAIEVDVTLDGQSIPGSPFQISQANPVSSSFNVAGNGLNHVISILSTDIPTCSKIINFTVPDCGSNCFLSGLNTTIPGGVVKTINVDDNFFNPQSTTITLGDIARFVWQGDGHSTTSDATTGPDAWNSGVISNGSVFDVIIDNPGTHNFYCIPHGGPNGSGMAGSLLANCPSGTSLNLQVSFNTSVANAAGYQILWDGNEVAGSPFDYNGTGAQSQIIQIVGDGTTHILQVKDVADPTCVLTLNYTTPDCNQGGGNPVCTINVTSNNNFSGCSNTNQVTLPINVTVANGGTSFNVTVDNGPATTINYTPNSTDAIVTLPGDGQTHTITVTDSGDPSCTDFITVTTPNCNLPCSITNLTANPPSGNGTPSGIVHLVNVADFVFNPNAINISLGDVVQWNWVGNVAHTSTSDLASGPGSWNSGLLGNGSSYTSPVLTQGSHGYYCEPHGAPGGVGMAGTINVLPPCNTNNQVNVQVNFNVASNGTSGYNILVDGIAQGPFAYTGGNAQSTNVLVTGNGGSHNIQVVDIADPSCTANTSVVTPDCNPTAPVCSMMANGVITSGCLANNTLTVDVAVTVSNGGTGCSISVDGGSTQLFTYSANNIFQVNVPGDGNAHNISVVDNGDASCTSAFSITTPNCNLPCALSNLVASPPSSGGNPSGIIHNVNVQDFVFNPATINITSGDVIKWTWTGNIPHTVTSDLASGPNSFDSGLIGNGSTFTSPVLSEGLHPYYCEPHGAPGGVGMAGTINVLPPCNSNNEVSVQITFNAVSPGPAGYNLFVDGVLKGNFPYGPGLTQSTSAFVIGNGQNHQIEVKDATDATCMTSGNVITPNCTPNAPICNLTASGQITGTCNNNTVAYTVAVNTNNGGTGCNVSVNNGPVTFYPYTNGSASFVIHLPGNGMNNVIVIVDNQNAMCSQTLNVITPDCTLPCNFSNIIASPPSGNGAPSGITHQVLVEDFVFNPVNINISSGDVIVWNWTGNIPHTTTSDTSSGPNSWNSGLIGNGSTYTSPVLSLGEHPYFCIPHGAAGGTGMAGNINVLPPCNVDNKVNVLLSFNAVGYGNAGYNLLVDGITNGPFPYAPGTVQNTNILVAGDGATHNITIQDLQNPACLGNTTVTTPDCTPAGASCALTMSSIIAEGCNTDNKVKVRSTVVSNNSGNSFVVKLDGQLIDTISYTGGNTIFDVLVSGDGMNHLILINDINSDSCTAQSSIVTPNCQSPCTINNLVLQFGLPVKRKILVRDFDFFPLVIDANVNDTIEFEWTGMIPHTATSDIQTNANSFNSGLLGNGNKFIFIPKESGNVSYYCLPHGAPNGIGMAGKIVVNNQCIGNNANGQLSFNYSGQSTGFNIFLDNILHPASPLAPDASGQINKQIQVTGDGLNHILKIESFNNANCNASFNYMAPSCGNNNSCNLSIVNPAFTPCSNGEVELGFVISSNQANKFVNVYKDNIKLNSSPVKLDEQGSFSYNHKVAANGLTFVIKVVVEGQINCQTSITLTAPNCGVFCLINNLKVVKNHKRKIFVRDFDYLPKEVEILLGDTVNFIWTGEIPHTVTSDAFTGPNIFSSGLLKKGDEYNLVLKNTGNHPYYCIPHGGPNNIGMAGKIIVKDTCQDDKWATNLLFDVTLGSNLGYNFFIDGVKQNDIPLKYDDPKGKNQKIILITGDGAEHLITLQDLETSYCASTVRAFIPVCGSGCTINGLEINSGREIITEVEVKDFDFVPREITIRAGETVRFKWTGNVPHTVTSDLISGSGSFNSGLLTKDATFDVVLNTTGSHPYYCIPHGGPKGIGQSGIINVLPECIDDKHRLQTKFNVTNGSASGYRVFLDGIQHQPGSLLYQNRRGGNTLFIEVDGDGKSHILTFQDVNNNICAASQFYASNLCGVDCSLNELNYKLNEGKRVQVLVRDFDYLPKNLKAEIGDTIFFQWVGDIPHTVTFDVAEGPEYFNSDLLSKGAQYMLPLKKVGSIGYYCIPHGSPGIGMAGSIDVTDECEDDAVDFLFNFISTGTVGTYDVNVNNIQAIKQKPYAQGVYQEFNLNLKGDGSSYNIEVIDNSVESCKTGTNIENLDCDDPCFGVNAKFEYEINFTKLEVNFVDKSTGNNTTYDWDFGNGITSKEKSPNIKFGEASTYEVCLTINKGTSCEKKYCDKLRLAAPVCVALFEYEQDGLEIKFINKSQYNDPASRVIWSFGDNSTSLEPESVNHIFKQGRYQVCITIQSPQCTNSYCEEIDLTDECLSIKPDFSFRYEDGIKRQVVFTNGTNTAVSNYLWGFGDGSTSMSKDAVHTYIKDGNYNVCLLVQDKNLNCSVSECKLIPVGLTSVNDGFVFQKLRIFPNPAIKNQLVNIKGFNTKNAGEIGKLTIYNNEGKILQQDKIIIEENLKLYLNNSSKIQIITIEAGIQMYAAMLFVE